MAEKAELDATTLYPTLSPQGNPEMKSLTAILTAKGMRLAVQPIAEGPRGYATLSDMEPVIATVARRSNAFN